ncbi:MAG: hypothetical protein KQH83_06155 [Actinobacteria bacterium]|nr:hypothetical protein [Actinomycetota bacterium]
MRSRLAALAVVLAAAAATAACGGEAVDTGAYDYLFGDPAGATGLGDSACRPELVVDGVVEFRATEGTPALLDDLRSRVLENPPALPDGDPYEDPSLVPADTSGVCAATFGASSYRLDTFADTAEADAAGAVVTHTGACGACSGFGDLAVYLEHRDLGDAVRACALLALGSDPEATRSCLLDIGFSEPCAQAWWYNSLHTRDACLVVCLDALNDPNHLPDGSLNPCLACDEAESGPVFKAVAGRTRRNSGIPTAICRPGESVSPVPHDAYP